MTSGKRDANPPGFQTEPLQGEKRVRSTSDGYRLKPFPA